MIGLRYVSEMGERILTRVALWGPIRRAWAVGPDPSDAARRLLICHVAAQLEAQGQNAGSSGNLSVRLRSRESITISPSGADKGDLVSSQLIDVDLSEEAPAGVSVELPMHRACYRSPGVGGVIHSHDPALTALGLRTTRLHEELPELDRAIGKIVRVPFLDSGSEALARAVGEAVADGAGVVLLSRHGALAVGRTLLEAYRRHQLAALSARSVLLSYGQAPEQRSPATD